MKFLLISSFCFALAGFAGETMFELEKTSDLLKQYDRYQQQAAEIITLDAESTIHFNKSGVLCIPLELKNFVGKKVAITIVFKMDSVPETPDGVNPSVYGFKMMLCGSTPEKKFWGFQLGLFRGSCDWKAAVRKMSEAIPDGLSDFRIELNTPGGKVWIDTLFIEKIL